MADATEAPRPEQANPLAARPTPVSAAFWVFLALIAFRLVLLPFVIIRQWSVTDGVIADSRAKYGETVATSTAGALHGANITSSIIVVALYGLCVLAAFRIRRGSGWARIVLTVLGAACIITGVLSWRSPERTPVMIVAGGIAGIVLLWLRPSNAWFRAARAAHRSKDRSQAAAETPGGDASFGVPASEASSSQGS